MQEERLVVKTVVKKFLGYCCRWCGHSWQKRQKTDYPNICPRCKTKYWDKDRPRKIWA